MKARFRGILCTTALVVASAGALEAQDQERETGIGWVVDLIHRLSGPRFLGPALSGYYVLPGEAGLRLRLTGAYRWSLGETGGVPEDATVTMLTVQPALELPVQHIPIDFAVGFALHNFGGDADSFWHYSVPVQAQWRPRTPERWVPRVGVVLHAFPSFDQDAFAPLPVTVSRDDSEAVWQFIAGLDYRFR